MTLDIDRFYTPDTLARTLTDALDFQSVNSCADPTCGHGQLLLSAEAQWPKADFCGLDIDRHAVRKVRRRRPQWIVSVGNLLSPNSLVRTQIFRSRSGCEVLLTNPPFSMGMGKGVVRPGSSYRCSVAMAHILAAIELFRPNRAIGAIVPESLLYSELDEPARDELAAMWVLEEILCVPQSTFNGTRARSTLIVLRPNNDNVTNARVMPIPTAVGVTADVVRGGLPVHEAIFSPGEGLPLVHSTDLSSLVEGSYQEKTVVPIGRGCVVGAVILLPRVGVPSIEQISPLEFKQPIQLSDCVIGLRFTSYESANTAANMIRARSDSLVSLYKGTGARYVTVRRVEEWCLTVGIDPHTTRVSIGKLLEGRDFPTTLRR